MHQTEHNSVMKHQLDRMSRFRWCLVVLSVYCLLFFASFPNWLPKYTPWRSIGASRRPLRYLVNTSACTTPDLDPWDESIKHLVQIKGRVGCTGRRSVTYVDGPILRINRTYVEKDLSGDFSYCKYQAISRPIPSDFSYEYNNRSDKLSTDVKMQDEFVRIQCFNRSDGVLSTTFHAFVLPKKEVESRCSLKLKLHLQQNAPLELLNVQMVGLDSVSRLNSIRQMPRTRDFLLNELGAVEMLGYNKVADNTMVNIFPMTTGKYVEDFNKSCNATEGPYDKISFIWKDFSNAGYRTLYAEDMPTISIFAYIKEGFRKPPADYYNRALAVAMEDSSELWNSNHYCIADMMETAMLLNYVIDFSRLFSNLPHSQDSRNGSKGGANRNNTISSSNTTSTNKTPHFGFSFITRMTHDNVNDAGFADEPHFNFLRRFRDEGYLNNTILIYFSDHGMRNDYIRETSIGKAEERLPMMFIILPPWFRSRYPRLYANLQTNRRRLTTPFDVYETLKDILYFDGQDRPASLAQRGISFFRQIPETRNCEHAHILPHWCMCLQRKPLNVTSVKVHEAAEGLLRAINQLLGAHLGACAQLSVKKVHGAEQIGGFGISTELDEFFQLTVETEPGGALFEGTLSYSHEKKMFSQSGDISRINAYGTQSHCIENAVLKKFCYCKTQL